MILSCKEVATVFNNPDDDTDLPKAIPPIAKIIILQGKLFKSWTVNKPGPKKRIMGIIEMIPEAPKKPVML